MSNLPYYDKATISNYGSRQHRRIVKRRAKCFEENKKIIGIAEILEEEDQKAAFAAYQEMRSKRKYDINRDALLYHYDRKVMSRKL